MLTLPNGKPIDEDLVELALQDATGENAYYMNMRTGEVVCVSAFDDGFEKTEKLVEDIESSENYRRIEPLESQEVYGWMEDFIDQIVAPQDQPVAEKLSGALMGKGAFRRFKGILHGVDERWLTAWYQWRDDHLHEAMKAWFTSLSRNVPEE